MEGHCSTGQSPQRTVVPMVEEESHRGHGCLSVVNVVCCQVEVYATS